MTDVEARDVFAGAGGGATVWIVNPYGTLPSEGWREYRSAMLARALVRRGYRVRWWISDIEHRSKQRRSRNIVDPLLPSNVTIQVVPTRAYRRNISLGRVRYEQSFGAGFANASPLLAPPDLIVLADPSLFFAKPVIAYAEHVGVPFILDVIDLWPELFGLLLPSPVRCLEKRLFRPLYHRRDRLVAAAAAVVAVTRDYLVAATTRQTPRRSLTVYLGVDPTAFPVPSRSPSAGEWLEVVYAGTLGDAYDMPTVMKAIEQIARHGDAIRFTIAGDGPWREQIRTLAAEYPDHVRFLGSIPAVELVAYYAAAHIGLASYAAGSTVSMPVKFYDYLAAGLATVGAMGGEAAELLQEGAGIAYRAGDADDLVAKLRHYFAQPTLLDQARKAGLDRAAIFNQERQHDRFAALVDDVLASKEG